ncbi:uncharacterized protein [Branchiostoma lanceolatum]|uniref:uncharacterized protein n=1 Tax=Branchiostoma lanceolatum TaxID=7740 RepID=UPI00345292BC
MGWNYNNWHMILHLRAPKTLTRIAVNNYGDTHHDVAAFRLQKSQGRWPYSWEDVASVDTVQGGTDQRQEFGGFQGTARYWKFVITRTHSGWQPWLRELSLHRIPSRKMSTSMENGESIRLVGGSSDYEGRVEVYHDGQWGTVCDDNFALIDANVVCRQLGYGSATGARGRATFGEGSGQIWLDNLACRGSETTIGDCDHSGWGYHNCRHNEDASVVCDKGQRKPNFMVRVGPNKTFSQNDQCGETYVDTPLDGQTIVFYCNPPISGRYVSVQLVERSDTLTLCEVEVYGTG